MESQPIVQLSPDVELFSQTFYRLDNEGREKFYRRVVSEVAAEVYRQVFEEEK